MKNRIFSIFASLMIALLLFSCDKKVETTISVINTEDATIQATVTISGYANTDDNSAGFEKVPDGTKIVFTVEKAEFINNAEGSLTFEATFANGVATINLPATSSGVEYEVEAVDFYADQTRNSGKTNGDIAPFKYTYTYEGTLNVISGMSYNEEFTFEDDMSDYHVSMVSISGIIEYNFDETADGNEKLSKAVTLEFYGEDDVKGGFYTSVQTTVAGTYSVSVPADMDIYLKYKFQGNVKDGEEKLVVYDFEDDDYFANKSMDDGDVNIYLSGMAATK